VLVVPPVSLFICPLGMDRATLYPKDSESQSPPQGLSSNVGSGLGSFELSECIYPRNGLLGGVLILSYFVLPGLPLANVEFGSQGDKCGSVTIVAAATSSLLAFLEPVPGRQLSGSLINSLSFSFRYSSFRLLFRRAGDEVGRSDTSDRRRSRRALNRASTPATRTSS